ncbi:asparagine synthase (glutamine-hydrolyzing) [bacterium]|nr:asparagine synthase (glutamine-hydrolyzing) [bacterium]
MPGLCGIAGLVALDSRRGIDPALLDRMTDSLAHRGPDGRGVWIGDGVGFGHRRLAIIDKEGGAQPWLVDEGSAALVYNGELYNHLELRDELERDGVRFRSRCDTEVVALACVHWGVERALQKFRGMFAFALWEAAAQRLTLVRDPIGVKPLYWGMRDGILRFGSEIKSILSDPRFPRTPDATVIANYLSHYRLNLDGNTLFRQIKEVQPGTCLVWEGKRRNETRYWSLPAVPEAEKEDPGEEAVTEEFRSRLREAVKRRMMADVPLGAYLSGGIDSTVIVRLLKEMKTDELHTFSIGFEQQGFNEFGYATLVAQQFGIPHKQVNMTSEGYFNGLPELIRVKDTPLSVPNEVPLRFLSRILKSRMTVVLSGEGADELLGGYTLLMRSPHDFLLARQLAEGDDAFNALDRARLSSTFEQLYGDAVTQGQKAMFLKLYRWMQDDELQRLFRNPEHLKRSKRDIGRFWDRVWGELDAARLDPYDKVLQVLERYHLGALLLRLDATTMAHSVEGRVPYTDIDLVEWVSRLPLKYKLRWKGAAEEEQSRKVTAMEAAGRLDVNKYILRRAFRDQIPPLIADRPKTAFPVPLDEWLYGPYKQWAKERILTRKMGELFNLNELESFLSSKRGKAEGMKLWMLVNLSIWLEMYT